MATLSEIFPLVLKERALRFDTDQTSSQAILLEQCADLYAENLKVTNALLTQLGETVFQLGHLEHDYAQLPSPEAHIADALAILKANLLEALQNQNVRLLDLTDLELTPELRNQVEIRAQQLNPAVTIRKVLFMEEPLIKRGSEVISKGVVTIEIPEDAEPLS